MKYFKGKGLTHKHVKLTPAAVFIFVLCMSIIRISAYADEIKGTIKIGGTGNALGAFRELGEAFRKSHPGINFVILPSLGSSGGIKAVNEGALDIGLSSRQLKDTERQQGGSAVDFAKTPFVFVVSGRPSAINLSLKDIAKFYSGETSSWPDGMPVRIVLRPESDSDTGLIKNISPEIKDALQKAMSREGMPVAMSDQDNADTLENIPGSLGVSTIGQIISEKRHFTAVTLGGVVPSVQTLADGAYPYSKPLFLVTGPKSGPHTKSFMKFINSADGKTILKNNGFLVLSGK